jgi:hypothetical protein
MIKFRGKISSIRKIRSKRNDFGQHYEKSFNRLRTGIQVAENIYSKVIANVIAIENIERVMM